jgi:hypothetical protein
MKVDANDVLKLLDGVSMKVPGGQDKDRSDKSVPLKVCFFFGG